MKSKRAFTIIEMVIVLAVASILFAILAGLSVLTNNIFTSQKALSSTSAEYQNAKSQIEDFFSNYSSDYYYIELSNDFSAEIYDNIEAPETCIAKIEFDAQTKRLKTFKLDEDSALTLQDDIGFKQIENVVFDVNAALGLMKVSLEFSDNNTLNFLVNMGGMEIGNIS